MARQDGGTAEDPGAKRLTPSEAVDEIGRCLVLADAGDPDSLRDIVDAVGALGDALGPGTQDPVFAAFLERACVLASGAARDPLPELEALGALFESLQRMGNAHTAEQDAAAVEQPSPAPASADAMPLAGDEELLRDFVTRAGEHLESADEHLLILEKDPSDTETLNSVFRVFHTIKGMAGFLGLTEVESVCHQAESVLDGPRKGKGTLDRHGFDAVFGAVDTMKVLVSAVASPSSQAPAPVPSPRTAEETRRRTTASAGGGEAAPALVTSNSVRVDEERLDRMLDMIGELVIAESMFSESARALTDAFNPLATQLSRLDKITRELQEMATSLRMVPLKSTFVRAARLVRDVAAKADRQVEFATSGEDTELDKLVVDRIYDPLVHILRNAVDHGIEPAEERVAAGKAATGRVELRAYHGGGGIHIEIEDDGRGFDLDAVVAKARERGLLGADETPSERDAMAFVFEPGLSTARRVTDVSGRGVGMDVVRRVVESLRGQVDIRTEPGRGTCISIRLPLTLAIIDGMVVRVGTERYIIPTLSIERSLRPGPEQLSEVLAKGTLLELDGALMPLVQLGDLFDSADAQRDPTRGIVVVVGSNGDRIGLVACEILGQQQIVIKSLGDSMQQITGIAGGAIMPDGRVGLIVDVGGLAQLARS